jgi:hypothetical protein
VTTDMTERFWAKVDKTGDCWTWCGALDKHGYGAAWDGSRVLGAHRLSYELTHGSIGSSRVLVMHRCDNPPCVNPAHLMLGSHKDNTRDAMAKGRLACGERSGTAKLTRDVVIAIRRELEAGASQTDLARRFTTDISNIGKILRRETWRRA